MFLSQNKTSEGQEAPWLFASLPLCPRQQWDAPSATRRLHACRGRHCRLGCARSLPRPLSSCGFAPSQALHSAAVTHFGPEFTHTPSSPIPWRELVSGPTEMQGGCEVSPRAQPSLQQLPTVDRKTQSPKPSLPRPSHFPQKYYENFTGAVTFCSHVFLRRTITIGSNIKTDSSVPRPEVGVQWVWARDSERLHFQQVPPGDSAEGTMKT